MRLDTSKWKEFLIKDLFIVKYGVNLELNACEESLDENSINFVSRTAENNGVSAKVKKIENIVEQKAGLISVAGGGSVLSTFLQAEPFYSGRDLYTLETKEELSEEIKLFLVTIISANKYKYNYGRQANKTLPFIELKLPIKLNNDNTPVIDNSKTYSSNGYIPDWQFMEDYIKSLHYKPITTKNRKYTSKDIYKTTIWKEFKLIDLFGPCERGTRITQENREPGNIPFVTAGEYNLGVSSYISNTEAKTYSNALTIDMFGNCYYFSDYFKCDDNILVFWNNNINPYTGMFLATVIQYDKYKYGYGRQYRKGDYKEHIIFLPVTVAGEPDWQFMEDYIKSLPYGDRI